MDKNYVLSHIAESKQFAQHVTEKTKGYIESLNLPTNGVLIGFGFDEEEFYTVNHVFEYNGEQKTCFYRIPLSILWD